MGLESHYSLKILWAQDRVLQSLVWKVPGEVIWYVSAPLCSVHQILADKSLTEKEEPKVEKSSPNLCCLAMGKQAALVESCLFRIKNGKYNSLIHFMTFMFY